MSARLRPHLRHVLLVPTFLVAILASLTVATSGATGFEQASAPPAYRVSQGMELKRKPPEWVLPVDQYRLTGRFGASGYTWSSTHTGLDFAAPSGTPLRSIAPGVVTAAGYDGAYGYKTVVTLADGTDVWYCHQDSLAVGVGDRLRAGEVLGAVGATGNVTGSHLHLEIHPGGGRPVDPYAVLVAHGLQP